MYYLSSTLLGQAYSCKTDHSLNDTDYTHTFIKTVEIVAM